jgi:NTP-dependent ternary system trypsin peptidase co-occuring protein
LLIKNRRPKAVFAMSRFVEVPLASGGSITVEVDDGPSPRTMRGASPADLVERGSRTLEQGLADIAPALQEVLAKLRGVSTELSQIEVELGLKLTGEAGMVVARAGAEANFRVLVRWERPSEGNGR